MSYISRADVTDNIISNFDLAPYLIETDNEIIDLAESLGVSENAIETNPLHNKIKRYAIAFCLMRLCQDKTGSNNIELPEMEKYVVKYEIYRKEVEKLRQQINYEMFTGTVLTIRDRAVVSGTIYRG